MKHLSQWLGRLAVVCAVLGVLWSAQLLFAESPSTDKDQDAGSQVAAPVDPFSGLPPMKARGDEAHFRFRPGPRPPGTITKRVKIPFPAPIRRNPPTAKKAKPPTVKSLAQPLKIVRMSPQGRIGNVHQIVVSFNQPMVPLTSLKQLKSKAAPFVIQPQIPGRFRWLDTKTALFQPKGRIPYSTRYRVVVPKGLSALSGRSLRKTKTYFFTTPRLRLVRRTPYSYSPTDANPIIAMQFNQKIDLRSFQSRLRFRGPTTNYSFRLISEKEWGKKTNKAYAQIRSRLSYWKKEHTVVLRPSRPLPLASRYTLSVRRGTKSAEGPLRSNKTLRMWFRTYGPLRVTRRYCSQRTYSFLFRRCRPRYGISITFSNALDYNQKLPWNKLVETHPKLEKLQIRASGRYISLSHPDGFPPGKSLTVVLKRGIRDQYKQTLGLVRSDKDVLRVARRYTFRFADAAPYMRLPRYQTATLEWKGDHALEVKTRNIFTLRQRLIPINVGDLSKAMKLIREIGYSRYRRRDPVSSFGFVPKVDQTIKTKAPKNKKWKHTVSLTKALGGKPGWVLVVLSSNDLFAQYRYAIPHRALLVRVTDLGLTTRYGPAQIVSLLTGLQSGKPVSGVKVSLYHYGNTNQSIASQTSKATGLSVLPGVLKLKQNPMYYLVAEHNGDKTFLPINTGGRGAVGYLSSYGTSGRRYHKRWTPQYHIFADRSPHKPGETVQLTGILRMRDNTPKGGVAKLPPVRGDVHFRIRSPRWRVVKKGKLKLEAGGTFKLQYTAPEDADLGNYRLEIWFNTSAGAYRVYHNFKILAYRAPEFKVKISTKTPGPFYFDDTLTATVEGRYTFGAPMRGAQMHWTFRRYAGNFRPPNQPSGFRFGKPHYSYHGWGYGGYRRGYGHYRRWRHRASKLIKTSSTKLDKNGQHTLKLPLKKDALKGPGRFVLEARVYGKNRQSIANRKTIIAHTSSLYLGLKTNKPMVRAGQRIKTLAFAVDPTGQRQKGVTLKLVAFRREQKQKPIKTKSGWTFQYSTQEKVVAQCQLVSTLKVQSCRLKLPKAGRYTIRASAKDKKGRAAITETYVYAYGEGYTPSQRPEHVEIIPDRKSYKPGQKARLLVNAPFRSSYGLLTLERNGIAEYSVVSLKGSSQSIVVPVRSEYLPNFHVSLVLLRGRMSLKQLGIPDTKDAEDLGRPMAAYGSTSLRVTLHEKRLRIKVTPSTKQIRPGSSLKLKLSARDHRGKSTPVVYTVALVDEGVLSLLGFQTPDPLKALYVSRPAWTVMRSLRTTLLSKKKEKTKGKHKNRRSRNNLRPEGKLLKQLQKSPPPPPSPGGGRDKDDDGEAERTVQTVSKSSGGRMFGYTANTTATRGPRRSYKKAARPVVAEEAPAAAADANNSRGRPSISVRSKFASTAFYKTLVRSDRNGEAELSIKMPDNLTTFRVMVVAVDLETPDRFGNGESQVVIRKPLLLRPALPRFANFGDSFEASVVINNETGKDGTVAVLTRGINIVYTGATRKNIFVPAGQAREVRFPVKVAKTGTARIQFAAILGQETDGVERSIPILIPATAAAFATYGSTTKSVAQVVEPPKDALAPFGGLKISLSSTALNGLEDAARYLITYPFECNEQTASRIMPIIALRRILPEFKIGKVSDPARMKSLAIAGIRKLSQRQRSDGGWGYWGGSRNSWMFISAYITQTLLRAQKAGYNVDKRMLNRAQRFLSYRLRYPHRWERKSYTSQVMALWTLSMMKNTSTSYLRRFGNKLYKQRAKLPMFGKAWLMVALHRGNAKDPRVSKLLQVLRNNVTETSGAAHFVEGATESLRRLMHSNDRSDAIILQTLLDIRPKEPLIPKLVRGLMRSRIRGRWSTTQANAFAMIAMDQYFRIYEKIVPDFTVSHWLGDGYLGGTTMKGRKMGIKEQMIPMRFLMKQGRQPLVLEKKGKGRLYYRIGMRYAPKSLKLKATSEGFTVKRTYEPVEGKDTVFKGKDGRWKFRAGSYVRVRLTVVVPARRFYAAVVDPLPAGLEAVNLGLKTSASSYLGRKQSRRVYGSRSYYSYSAFNHTEKRDSMVVLFADRLPAGVYEYAYLARATTLGNFIVPPTRAEEMYSPETFGRSSTLFADVIPAKDKK
ncbi:MAG: hypothetical protein EP343_04580 [Deltaproteobacteria bacterium]|nr:MAG: hypothetical protein EP343_04580 [Deltaproteobacteria bacterium]